MASSSRATSREATSASSTPYFALARASVPLATSRMRNVGRHPTRRRMVAPRAYRSCSTGPVPLSGSRRTPHPELLKLLCQRDRHSVQGDRLRLLVAPPPRARLPTVVYY